MKFVCEICSFEAKNENGLRAHMRKHKDLKEQKTEVEAETDEKVDETDKKEIKVVAREVRVYDKWGAYVRTYSERIHGKNYLDLAKEFTAKNKGYSMR